VTDQPVVLIVEDNPQNAEALSEMVQSMDMVARVVTTLADVRELLASGFVPDAVLQDMQIPHAAGARPHEKSGESSIALVQARFGKGVVPIIVVTAFRSDPDYVWQMAELDVDGFVAKSNIESLPDKLRGAMNKVRRAEPGRPAAVAAVAPEEGTVTLAMDGEPIRGRTSLRTCGEPRTMGDAPFAVLLRAVLAHERAAGSWTDKYELGIGDDRAMTNRVREPFKGLVPERFAVLEGDRRKQFRLNPAIVVERVNWEEMAKHPHAAIRNVAAQALKRTGRGVGVEA